MSCEPLRRAPYLFDLRWKVVWQRLALALTYKQISRNISISVSTAQRVYRLFELTGNVSPKQISQRTNLRKLNSYMELFIIGLVLETPNLFLLELCNIVKNVSGIEVSPATVCRLLHKHGFTRKRIRQTALQRSIYARGSFIAQVQLYDRQKFVWLDETGCDNRDYMRKYGYVIRGQTPHCRRLLVRGNRISVIAAIACDGLVAMECTTRTISSDNFFDFVRGTLIPQMSPFDGTSSKSIVILDNCSVYHVPEVISLFASVGILLFFLPPYSPDYNPIEEVFSYVKGYLRPGLGPSTFVLVLKYT